MNDKRTRLAVEVGERVADGIATEKEATAAIRGCHAAIETARRKGWKDNLEHNAANVPYHAVAESPYQIRYATLLLIRMYTALAHSTSPHSDQLGKAAEKNESAAQMDLLRELFGNPFRPVHLDASWLTPTVVSLAHAAYDERILPSGQLDLARLAVLSDALEEPGCNDATLLDHLRRPGPHVRGCWALDLILGKQ